jgi:hypothetical protein
MMDALGRWIGIFARWRVKGVTADRDMQQSIIQTTERLFRGVGAPGKWADDARSVRMWPLERFLSCYVTGNRYDDQTSVKAAQQHTTIHRQQPLL